MPARAPLRIVGLGFVIAIALLAATARVGGAPSDPDRGGAVGSLVRPANAPLLVQITASPTTGTAPLTVDFRANASGGTGVFVSYLWQFGDGGTARGPSFVYTFLDAGNYSVAVVVTDNATDSGNASVTVRVAAPLPPGAGPPANPLFLPALGIGAAAGALGMYLALRWWPEREEEADEAGTSAPELAVAPAGPPGPDLPAPPGPMSTELAPAGPAPESLRLSQKVIVHLGVYGAPSHRQMARIESTQIGMARLFGASQSAISNVLQRLAEAGVVTSELRHVAGHGRRLRTYALTFRGEQIARDLQAQLRGSAGPSSGPAEVGEGGGPGGRPP
jgi:PKD repeat protein